MNTTVKVRVDEKLLQEIGQEIRETLAADVKLEKRNSTFCVADLWNIHRQKRQRVQRRFL